MLTENKTSFLHHRTAWAMMLVIVLVGLVMVLIPVWLIQPFRPQSQRGVELSYALRRWSPLVTLIASATVLILLVRLWPNSRRWWRKAALIIIFIPLLAATWFARQNHFEWIFNPLADATYTQAGEAGFIDDTDMVIAVEHNGEAVAYPVRLMAYHHLIQDVVGGTPIVATY